jgi:Zn-dependent peptidase ImmA (M78 family)/transcriptional regulator with XRE-family HTH domain
MTVGIKTFRGLRLKEARLALGLSKKALADMVGITGYAIARYEDGLDNPKSEKLDAIASKLNFPVEFFSRPEWREEIDHVFWRSRTTETKFAREMTEQRMRWACEIFDFLEQEVDFPQYAPPDTRTQQDFRLLTPDAIERAAVDTRHFFGFPDLSPIPDVTLALENTGIPVINLEIESDKQDGFCFSSKMLNRMFAGINIYNVSAARARFDAAHELGHIILHRHMSPQQSRDPLAHKIIEQQAHHFAGAFLFPKRAFMSEAGDVSLDYFCALKKKWGISIGAMIFRAFNLGLIDEQEKKVLFQKMGRRKWRGPLQEPFDNPIEMPMERPRMLRRGIEAVIDGGVFGRPTLRSALPLPKREIEQIAALDETYLDDRPVSNIVNLKNKSELQAVDMESGVVIKFPQRRKS